MQLPQMMSRSAHVCFVNFISYWNIIDFCNVIYVHVYKICEEKFGGCKRLFSWLCQKVKYHLSFESKPIFVSSDW